MPRCKELAEALKIIEAPVETETRCSKCRFRNNTTLWSCAYIDIVGVSKRLAFPHALLQELCETEGYPCIAFQEGERQDSPFRSISRLSKEQGRRSRQAQEKEFLRLYEGGIADRQIAKITGVKYSQVLSWRRQKGLPGNTKHGRPKKR